METLEGQPEMAGIAGEAKVPADPDWQSAVCPAVRQVGIDDQNLQSKVSLQQLAGCAQTAGVG